MFPGCLPRVPVDDGGGLHYTTTTRLGGDRNQLAVDESLSLCVSLREAEHRYTTTTVLYAMERRSCNTVTVYGLRATGVRYYNDWFT